ncbi:MAG: N-acetyltransferase [Prevotellaceae bacterium]|nr:N-acetyltransferase [Candidatus Colivivens equi]
MAKITIKEVNSNSELKKFIRFNYELYKDNPYSVPDLYEDMLNTFSNKNGAMEFCKAKYFLAYKKGKLVGRVAGIINSKSNDQWNERAVRFGWIDFIDDLNVSKALIDAVAEWGASEGMSTIHGPLGFTDFDAEGMLVEGFERLSTCATIYNYPYYPEHMEKLGFEKENDWVEYIVKVPSEIPQRLTAMAEFIMQRYGLEIKKYSSSRKIVKEYGHEIFSVLNEAYKSLFGFTALSDKQIEQYVKMYLPIVDLDLVSLITESDGTLVGVGISMPSLSKALQKAKGKLFPFGWIELAKVLKLHRHTDTLDLMLVGVLPKYQNKGVNSILFYDLIPIYNAKGYKYVETNPELEQNSKVQQQWIYFDKEMHKRRRCFKKQLED